MRRRIQFRLRGIFAALALVAFACSVCRWFRLEGPESATVASMVGLLLGPIYLRRLAGVSVHMMKEIVSLILIFTTASTCFAAEPVSLALWAGKPPGDVGVEGGERTRMYE